MAAYASRGIIQFDTGPLETGTQFQDPEAVIEAWSPEDVPATFAKLEAARSRGKWLAGAASYELGYALISRLTPQLPSARNSPLMRFGVFGAPMSRSRAVTLSAAALGNFAPAWDFGTYENAFNIIKDYLQSGDIYQANLTFPMVADWSGCPYSLYDALRNRQPVTHGALVDIGGNILLSRSPELFFAVSEDGQMQARPMKGTIHRSQNPTEDENLKAQLAHSEKDRAENLMITDLLRNDLGRISVLGSVKVPRLYSIESYATVHQMVSEITSQLRPGLGLSDIFAALFPCGSVTGAPKIRAMQILSDVETTSRENYCGAIGWIAPNGAMEFNVAIRTITLEPAGRATLNVGGGVVYDSTAEGEYREAQLKAKFARMTA